MDKVNKGFKRLVIELPETTHRHIRISAAKLGMSLKSWLIMACTEKLKQTERDIDDTSVSVVDIIVSKS